MSSGKAIAAAVCVALVCGCTPELYFLNRGYSPAVVNGKSVFFSPFP